jgi:hypothetical protein
MPDSAAESQKRNLSKIRPHSLDAALEEEKSQLLLKLEQAAEKTRILEEL